jgi:hypothetical protein
MTAGLAFFSNSTASTGNGGLGMNQHYDPKADSARPSAAPPPKSTRTHPTRPESTQRDIDCRKGH